MEECEQRNLLEFYELGETIGNGGFGAVYAGQSRLTGDSVSVCIHTGVFVVHVHLPPLGSWELDQDLQQLLGLNKAL